MHIRDLRFTGYFEEQDATTSEVLQIVCPDNELEGDLLAWALLPVAETIDGDYARRDYTFHYELGTQLDPGLYALTVTAEDASGRTHAAEIAAALATVVPATTWRRHGFVPLWLLSESVHFKPLERIDYDRYHGPAYGHLRFGADTNLPHRRLFGAIV
ncbi:MAG: hypothetical protein GX591_01475 [Planctomycetes bacterium]|nr:hypothetical protein [Planctomycetota bacterium]